MCKCMCICMLRTSLVHVHEMSNSMRVERFSIQCKDPSELLGRMASGGDLPHFLLASDPYPECEALPEERRRELRDAARNVTAAKLLPWFRRGRGDVSKYTHSIAIMCD